MPNYEYKCQECGDLTIFTCCLADLEAMKPKKCLICRGIKFEPVFSTSKAIWKCDGSFEAKKFREE